jgi:monoamine oxidase
VHQLNFATLYSSFSATGLFDQAFSEGVLDSFTFEIPDAEEWFCIDGGTYELVKKMKALIPDGRIQYERPVIGIESHPDSIGVIFGKEDINGYSTVFNTASFGCTGQMDLRNLSLTSAQRDAIRELNYDASAKVGIKFTNPWWITRCGITEGGSASTDLPLRTCVYPSYNLHDDPEQPAVLLCSYTWSQDASRISALIKDSSPSGEQQLKALLLHELWRLHESSGITEADIVEAYVDHYSFNWYHDPYSVGAFALYGPSQFENLYPYIIEPASGSRLHFVGEAASTHHGWVVGALDSAYRAVYSFLYRFGPPGAIERLEAEWGINGEVESGENGTIHLQVALSTLKPKDRVRVPTNPAAFDKQLYRHAPKAEHRAGKTLGWRSY